MICSHTTPRLMVLLCRWVSSVSPLLRAGRADLLSFFSLSLPPFAPCLRSMPHLWQEKRKNNEGIYAYGATTRSTCRLGSVSLSGLWSTLRLGSACCVRLVVHFASGSACYTFVCMFSSRSRVHPHTKPVAGCGFSGTCVRMGHNRTGNNSEKRTDILLRADLCVCVCACVCVACQAL